jgi:hypothetical protein
MIITNNYLPGGEYCAFIHESEKDEIKSWPDENGAIPRDMSLGYVDLPVPFGRLHVYPQQLFINKAKSI